MLTIAIALACAGCAPMPEPVPIDGACAATDGDTIRCGEERIRLLGIDAPELAGHCRAGRRCAPGDGPLAAEALATSIKGKPLTIARIGQDRYGRTLAAVYAAGVNVSCAQLGAGQAIYRRDWDNRGAVRRDCPSLAR